MKRQVVLSNSSIALTMITIIVFVAIMAFVYKNTAETGFIICCAIICAVILVSLFYVPMAVEVSPKGVTIIRCLRRKRIPLSAIESAMPLSVPAGTRRICGSGGFMGHWGWFQAPGIGLFFGYYGKSTNCFMIKLKNGRKYLLGCYDYEPLCDYLESLIGPKW